jgi:hypothetical protein
MPASFLWAALLSVTNLLREVRWWAAPSVLYHRRAGKTAGRISMRKMKSWFVLCAALFVVFSARPMFGASDMTGKWTTTDMKAPDGSAFTLTFDFKQEGTKLTGTVTGPQGDPLPFDNGKVDGDKFSFTVSFNNMTITHNGTIDGDEIKMSTKSDGDMPAMDMTLKRSTGSSK